MAFARFDQTIYGRRTRPGEFVHGTWRPGVEDILELRTSVQPSPDKDLKLLPEGRRLTGAYTLRSRAEIREGDIVELYGAEYEVLRVATWQNKVQPHYHAVAVKMQARET